MLSFMLSHVLGMHWPILNSTPLLSLVGHSSSTFPPLPPILMYCNGYFLCLLSAMFREGRDHILFFSVFPLSSIVPDTNVYILSLNPVERIFSTAQKKIRKKSFLKQSSKLKVDKTVYFPLEIEKLK